MAAQATITLELDDKGSVKLKKFGRLSGDVERQVANASQKMQRAWARMSGAVSRLHNRMKSFATGIPTLLGSAAITAGFAKITKMAAEQEDIFRRLEFQVETTGISYAKARDEINSFLTVMQDTTRFGDTDMAPVIGQITQLTGDLQKGLQGAKLAADIASSGLFNLQTASRLIAQAMQGNVEILGRYIPELRTSAGLIDKNMTAAQKWAIAQELLNKKFSGAAISDLKTYNGALAQLQNFIGDVLERFGDIITQNFAGRIRGWTSAVREFITSGRLDAWANATAEAFSTVTGIISGVVAVIKGWVLRNQEVILSIGKAIKIVGAFGVSIAALASPITQVGLAVVGGIEIWGRWGEQIKEVVSSAWAIIRPFINGLIQQNVFVAKVVAIVAKGIWGALKSAFEKVVAFAKPVFDFLANAWKKIKQLVSSVADTIGAVWSKTTEAMKKSITEAAKEQEGFLGQIAKAAQETFTTDYVTKVRVGVAKGVQFFAEGIEAMKTKLLSLGQVDFKPAIASVPDTMGKLPEIAPRLEIKSPVQKMVQKYQEGADKISIINTSLKDGFETLWGSLVDTSLSGGERIARVWQSMRDRFIQVTGEMIMMKNKEAGIFIAQEAKKTAVFLANSAKRIAAVVVEIGKTLALAAAQIAQAAAHAVKAAIAALGPFGIPVAIGSSVAIIAQWSAIKSSLGFQDGGFVPGGRAEYNSPVLFQPSGRDRVPIMAEPGEFIIRKSAADRLGPNILTSLNRTGTLPTQGNQVNIQGDTIIVQGFSDTDLLSEIRSIKERSREQLKEDIEFLIKRRRLVL